jgi:hypothetical protein
MTEFKENSRFHPKKARDKFRYFSEISKTPFLFGEFFKDFDL